MIHPDQEPDYQSKLEQAARNWLENNSSSRKTVLQVASEIRENNLKNRVNLPCIEFDYSGTIWCDRCGFEAKSHPAKIQLQEETQEPKIKSRKLLLRAQKRAKQKGKN